MTQEFSLSSIFFHFCSLILSHPLYFSYLLFFSPYILKLLSFISPLLTTTSLFLLAFFTLSQEFPLPPQDDLHEWFNLVFQEATVIPSPVQEAETKDIVEDRSDSLSSSCSPKRQIKQRDEWRRRTQLGFKLFEERYDDDDDDNNNNNNKEDEMDLLWETYEDKETAMGKLVEDNKGSSCDSKKKKDLRSLVNEKETEEEEEEEEEEIGKICCLQALKFSTRKMRFGIGKRSGLTKISKAFKGLKFLHQLNKAGKSRHS